MAASRRTRVRIRLKRWIANPIASVVLAWVLAGDAFTLSKMHPRSSAVGKVLQQTFGVSRTLHLTPSEIFILREPDNYRVIDPETESWDELSSLITSGSQPVIMSSPMQRTWRQGFWAPTSATFTKGIRLVPITGQWSPEQITQARATLFNTQTQTMPCWEWFQQYLDVKDDNIATSRVLWGGVAHNGFALLILGLLLYSFTGWPSWFTNRSWSKRSRRLARSHCPDCGYDLSGNTTGICPECGHARTPPQKDAEP